MSNKHAYLIMAHDQYKILISLLKDIDDSRNDIFLHIDKKSKNVPWKEIKLSVKKANLFLVERLSVNWGGYSQIQCEIHLLETAKKNGTYRYYHFLCGTEYPLRNQDEIHSFFDKNNGKEFLEYDEVNHNYMNRIKYIHHFNENGRPNIRRPIHYIGHKIRLKSIEMQEKKGMNYTKQFDYVFKKGNANWSITDELASFVISKKQEIYNMYKNSYCADEVYLHTLVYNSKFYEAVYRENGITSNARKQQWDREDNCYSPDDIDFLYNSTALFARKFRRAEGEQAINKIMEYRNQCIS